MADTESREGPDTAPEDSTLLVTKSQPIPLNSGMLNEFGTSLSTHRFSDASTAVSGSTPPTRMEWRKSIPQLIAERMPINIKYKLECRNPETSDCTVVESVNTPFDLPHETVSNGSNPRRESFTANEPQPVLELVTSVHGYDTRSIKKTIQRERDPLASPAPLSPDDLVRLKDIQIKKVGKSRMIIRSQLLLDMIREVVAYYPRYAGSPVILIEYKTTDAH